jgi:hypothetical protein
LAIASVDFHERKWHFRKMIVSNKGLARRLNELEKKYDGQFRVVFEAIRELIAERLFVRKLTPCQI